MNSHKGAKPAGSGPSGMTPANESKSDARSTGEQPAAGKSGSSGRVSFDSRGNSVWEWKTEETGKYSTDVNTGHLKKLEATDLSLEDNSKAGKVTRQEVGGKYGPGFNPYDRGSVAGVERSTADSKAPERKPIKDLRRYNEFLKLKQRMAEKKDEDE